MGVSDELRELGVARGDLVALTLAQGVGVAMATPAGTICVRATVDDPANIARTVDDELRPRWVMWSNATATTLVEAGVRLATGWDIAAVHRLLFGGWRADEARVWALLHDLTLDAIPTTKPPDLFTATTPDGSPDEPVRADGYLRPDWASGEWSTTPERVARWAELALVTAELQQSRLAALADRPRATGAGAADVISAARDGEAHADATKEAATARIESAAELLCAELSVDGLPFDRMAAEALIAEFVGTRPRSDIEAAERRVQRDAEVLRHAPLHRDCDLRSPGQVKELLSQAGFDLPDTRAWRLEAIRESHPLIGALLTWRKAERVATTYGYAWLDEHLDDDGRLRGAWSGSDGAAGRMTASAGLHNMPADMRGAVIAEAGHAFVRADLGQIEPRVLAAVSGDEQLARATQADDMYAPVATQLGVDRAIAKVAVLGAMYGQTTGQGARALRGLDAAYPVAMAYLQAADNAGQRGVSLRTYGGRLIRMGAISTNTHDVDRDERSRAAAQGRYGRNAMIQGAAAELFKAWAVTVRARAAAMDARIVLCLHDELLVHVPTPHAEAVAQLLHDCLREAAHRWAPDDSVRFVADVSVLNAWSEAKD
jgi:DNA polymerase-1